MQENVYEKISNYIDTNIDPYSSISIDWIGGEPLLYLEYIKKYSQKYISIAKNHKKLYMASITTNGYLLSVENAEILLDSKILTYQITVDGSSETHNLTRHSPDIVDNYSQIVRNIIVISSMNKFRHINFIIRINVTENILRNTDLVIDSLKSLQLSLNPQFQFYLVPAWDTKKSNYMVSLHDYWKFAIACKNGNLHVNSLFSKPNINLICPYLLSSNFLVNFTGNVYKCLGYNKFGTLDNQGKINKNPCFQNDKRNILISSQCSNCKLYPICFGKICPYEKSCFHNFIMDPALGKSIEVQDIIINMTN